MDSGPVYMAKHAFVVPTCTGVLPATGADVTPLGLWRRTPASGSRPQLTYCRTQPTGKRGVLGAHSVVPRRPACIPGSTPRSRARGALLRMMFTGIVEEIGVVDAITNLESDEGGVEMTLKADVVLGRTQLGDSIAVNGTCLTVTHLDADAGTFTVGLAPETLRRTNLGALRPASRVNLERSLAADGRVGGHFVQGHVDGTGIIQAKRAEKDAIWFTICPEQRSLLKYLVPKGYVAVDGTSLTVVNVTDTTFDFMMVPYTQEHVIIPSKAEGDVVNVEVDITGKYIEKFLSWRD